MAGPLINKKYALLEEGKAPIGMHKGKYLRDLPASTLLYYCDLFEQMDDTVYGQYISKCIDVALELGYIKARDDAREAAYIEALKSDHVYTIGERVEIECTITAIYVKDEFITNIMKSRDDIIKYFGGKLGEVGETIKIKCTIKRHDLWDGVKSTTVSRPKRV